MVKKAEDGTLVTSPSKRERDLKKKLAAAERNIAQQAIEIDFLKRLQVESSQSKKRYATYRDRLSVASSVPESVAK